MLGEMPLNRRSAGLGHMQEYNLGKVFTRAHPMGYAPEIVGLL